MKLEAEGALVFEGEEVVTADRLAKLAAALGTESAAGTATLVPWFGPTVAGEQQFVEILGLDLSRALLGGLAYRFERPFVAEETVTVKVFVEKVFDKGSNRFGLVAAEFTDKAGVLVQRQSATFIERMGD
jgi:acyl dehydratase